MTASSARSSGDKLVAAEAPGRLVGEPDAREVDREARHEDRPVAEHRGQEPREPRAEPAGVGVTEAGNEHGEHGGEPRARRALVALDRKIEAVFRNHAESSCRTEE